MNKPSINFGFQFVHDGSANSVSVNLMTGPIYYNNPAQTGLLNGAVNALASSAQGVLADSGLTVTTWSMLLGVLTVNFTGTVAAGTICSINGALLF